MAKRATSTDRAVAFDEACDVLKSALADGSRRAILERLLRKADPSTARTRLRVAMRDHRFVATARELRLSDIVERLEQPSRDEGFHVMRTWDPVRHRFLADSTPVLMVDYAEHASARGPQRVHSLAVLLDCYFLFVLMLLVMRSWDTPDPDGAFARVEELLADLQGPQGSSHRFVDTAPSLVSLAISQYQPHEPAYDDLLAKVRSLSPSLRLDLALVNAANFGSHLRWGFHFMYGQDLERMRADNVVDYPWVLETLVTLTGAYSQCLADGAPDGRRVCCAEGILSALSPDPTAFLGDAPSAPRDFTADRSWLAEALTHHRSTLERDIDALAPNEHEYSPLGLQFNFLHNVLTAKLALAAEESPAVDLSLNRLLVRERERAPLARSPEVLSQLLMAFAREPARLEARGAPLIVYDAATASAAYARSRAVLGHGR